jgi:hypothetical protein
MAAWRPRISRDDEGKLHFVYARYDDADSYQRCGMTGIGGVFNKGASIEDMRHFARSLPHACDEPIISMTEREREPGSDDDIDE